MIKKFAALFTAVLISTQAATPIWGQATLLPNAKQTFVDTNGAPLASGTVDLYVPNTTTRKNTWTNSTETSLNTNPVTLDAAGRAIIFGQGSYRQIVKDSLGNTQWDAVTTAPQSGTSVFLTDGAPVGTMLPYSGLALPTNYLWAFGQAVSRTTYVSLLAAITSVQTVTTISTNTTIAGFSDTTQFRVGAPIEGTCLNAGTTIATVAATSITVSAAATSTGSCAVTVFPHGNGNGSTTFNVPEMRGRVPAGRDNLGGTAAATLTNTYCTAAGAIGLGSTCGAQSQTLIGANLPAYTPAGTVAQAAHSHFIFNGDIATVGSVSNTTIATFERSSGMAGQDYIVAGSATAATLGLTSNTTATSTFTGTPQGGTSTAFSNVQPTTIVNYVIKYQASDPTGNGGVVSLGGMTGDILCGAGTTCSGGAISVTGAGTGDVHGPASSITGNIPIFADTTGKNLSDSLNVIPNKITVNSSVSSNGGDPNFNAGGQRAFMDFASNTGRMGSLNGGGAPTGLDLYSGGFRFLSANQSAGLASLTWNNLGTATMSVGLPASNAGGIFGFNVSGNSQVVSLQVLPTSGTVPTNGPISEYVTHIDASTNYQRLSFTSMAAFANPTLTSAANDFRWQQEAGGSAAILPMKFSAQQNTTGNVYVYFETEPDGGLYLLPEVYFPATSSANRSVALGQARSSGTAPLSTPSTQDSPAFAMHGNSLSATNTVTITASVAGTTLTVTAVSANNLATGMIISDAANLIGGTRITGQLTGTAGGVGTYTVFAGNKPTSATQTVASESMTATAVQFPTFQRKIAVTSNAGAATEKLQFKLNTVNYANATPPDPNTGWTDVRTCTSTGVCAFPGTLSIGAGSAITSSGAGGALASGAFAAAGITALTGDVTATGPGSVASALATVNGNVGTFGSSTSIPTFTVNAKGLITAASGNALSVSAAALTGTTLASNVVTSSLTSVGTITSGVWTGTTVAVANGGTGLTAGTSGGVLAYTGTGTLASSGALTANNPVIGGGAGVAPSSGTRSGNTTVFATTSGSFTDGHCLQITSGNIVDAGGACTTGGGGGTVSSGTAGQIAYYASSGTVVTSNANLTISAGAVTHGQIGSVLGSLILAGNTSGAVTIQPQAAAGTYNFNLPTAAGTSGQPLLSGGGGAAAMTYGTLGVAAGGTGLTSGTSGGVLAYTASGTLASSGALTASAIVLGGGAGVVPTVLGSLGTTTTVLHGNAAGAPTFGAVALGADVSGTLPNANLANMANSTIKCRTTAGTGSPEDCTGAQVAVMLSAPVACDIILTTAATCNNGGSAANNGTYTTPTGTKYMIVEVLGAGAGGAGGGQGGAPGDGTAGGSSTFSNVTAGGGGTRASNGGVCTNGDTKVGGGAGGASPAGAAGAFIGGPGGVSYFGGNSFGILAGTPTAPGVNSGSGGAGGGSGIGVNPDKGEGGSAGAYCKFLISVPNATYSYTVGAGGTAGAAGTSGFAGIGGAAGHVIVTAYFQ